MSRGQFDAEAFYSALDAQRQGAEYHLEKSRR